MSKAKDRDLLYFTGVWILAGPITLFLDAYTKVKIGIEWNFFTGDIGYFILGYYLGKREYSRNQLIVVAGLFLLSVFATFAGVHVAKQIDPYVDYFERYLSLDVIVMAATGFVLISRVPINDMFQKFLEPQSKASFGVYLIHVMILGWMMTHPPFDAWYTSNLDWLVVPALTLVGYIISFVIVFVMQKIPIVRGLVP